MRAGRVVAADVERVEVQPLRLDLGAFGDLVAHADEDVGDPLHQRGQRVPGAARGAVPGQRDVDPLLGQHPRVALGLELGQPGVVGLGDRGAGRVDPLAGVATWRPAAARRSRGGPASTGARSPRCAGRTRGQRVQVGGVGERLLRGGDRVVERLRGEQRRPASGRRDRCGTSWSGTPSRRRRPSRAAGESTDARLCRSPPVGGAQEQVRPAARRHRRAG